MCSYRSDIHSAYHYNKELSISMKSGGEMSICASFYDFFL